MRTIRRLSLLLSLLVVIALMPMASAHADSLPALTVSDATVTEGNSGTVGAAFIVRLSYASPNTVTVNYSTANSSAVAPGDYTSQTNALVFAPGQTSKTVTVAVNGDLVSESKETFSLNLSGATNATVSDSTGAGIIIDDDLLPRLSVGDSTVTEGGTGTVDAVFPVTLSNPSSLPVKARYATVDGNAKTPADYAYTAGTVTFLPGETAKSVTVPVNGDTIDEGASERFTVNLSSPANAVIARFSGIGTVTDDDHDPFVNLNDVRVIEGDSGTTNATFTASLSAPSSNQITVNYQTLDSSAVKDADYIQQAGTLTFAPGQTSSTVTVPVVGDAVDEADQERFALALNSPVNVLLGRSVATGSIVDDDPGLSFPAPTVSVSDTAVVEGDSGTAQASFTVTLSNPSSQTTSVNYATSNSNAVAPADYTSTTGTLTFAPGQTTASVSVDAVGDALDETDEQFTLNLSGPLGVLIQDGQGSATIIDDDVQPNISADNPAVVEGNAGTTDAVFRVLLSAPSPNTVTLSYATSDSGGQAGTDYTAQAGALTFAPGETSKMVAAPVIGDTLSESNESFALNLSSAVNATIIASQGMATIVNDDTDPSLSINDTSVFEGNTGTAPAMLTVTLQPASANTVKVSYATADGSAKAGSDYVAQSGTLTFNPGETAKTIKAVVDGDTLDEGNETFSIGLSNPVNAALVDNQGQTSIVDDDVNPRVSVGDASVVEGDAGTKVTVLPVTLSSASANIVTVAYGTSDSSAQAGSDYVAQSGTLTFNPGETAKSVSVVVNGDTAIENDEQFTVSLSNPGNAVVVDGQGLVVIVSDDSTPTLSITGTAVVEDAPGVQTPATFAVTLAPASPNTVTVSYSTPGGSATAGSDFVTAAGVLTFAPGETSKQVPVTVLGDATDEAATESFSASLANAVNARLVSSTATGFIVDDDPTPSPSTFVNVSDATVTEGNSGMVNATFTVSLTAPSLATVTVPYSTSDSTAQAPPDYVAQNGTLSFAPGQTSKAVTVAVKGDTVDENDEQFSFSLGSPVNATLLRGTAVGTIVDNDTTARAWISDATVVEGNTGAAVAHFAVTLSAPSTAPVAIDWSTSDSSAVAPGDYVDDFDTLVFNPGQTTKTVDITVNPDTLAESTEAFSVNLNNAINALLTDSTGVGTILDMDTFVLSGKVTDGAGTALANVVVTRVGNKLPSASTKTDNTGTFSFEVPDGIYNLQPALAGYTFLPSAWNGVVVRGGSVTSSAFLAVHGVAITGRVLTTANAASSGVRIVRDANATQPQATVFTNPQGYYALSDTPAGSYGLSATNTTTDLFSPISTTVNVGAASVNGVDFINAFTPAIQGRVIDANGAGVAGVTITRTGNGQPAVTFTTNDLGYWALSDNVPTQAGTQYVITPTRAGLTFSPASKSVTVLQFSWPSGVNFTAS